MEYTPTTPNPKARLSWWLIIAYVFLLLEWGWLTLVYAKEILTSHFLQQFLSQETTIQPNLSIDIFSNTIVQILGTILAIGAVIFFFYMLVRLPKDIAKTGKTVVERPADALALNITHKYRLKEAKRLNIRADIILGTQLVMILMPFGIFFFADMQSSLIPMSYRYILCLILAGMALAGFVIEFFWQRHTKRIGKKHVSPDASHTKV